ncbi:hypothetical protein CHRYSEOSP005_11250 [Chryseobacterium sp. Alg-005]|uniref:hypothetical protein n=1 Tax=Chryseobacterium sp. Alg-005 TaxID=3159516 RepID=UPI003555AF14
MFTSYTDRVFKAYQKKKDEGKLSLNLVEPTPAKLKQECAIVYSERYKEKDGKILRLFFLPKDDSTDYGISIRNIDTDKFKPLSNFLKRKTSDTEDKNIELLAWLINFEPRPYNFKFNYKEGVEPVNSYSESDEEFAVIDEIKKNSENDPPVEKDESAEYHPEKKGEGKPTGSSKKKILIGSVLSGSLILFGYLGIKKMSNKDEARDENITDNIGIRRGIMTEQSAARSQTVEDKKDKEEPSEKISTIYIPSKKEMQCMYWKDDHYQEAFCDDENIPASLVAVDKNLVKNFKKITFPDTITEKSVNKIWYLKSDGKIEFFTHEGKHPTNNRELKKMSKYILDKYVYNN